LNSTEVNLPRALPAPAILRPIRKAIASVSSERVVPFLRSRMFFCERAQKDSIAVLSLAGETRPIEPVSSFAFPTARNARARRNLPALSTQEGRPDVPEVRDGLGRAPIGATGDRDNVGLGLRTELFGRASDFQQGLAPPCE
jgi:hypothetical protein